MKTIVLGPPGTGKTTTLLNLVDKYLKKTKTGITNSPTQMERTFKLG